MEDRKILFFDIDGTIICKNGEYIPESTIVALKKAQENGNIIIVNTGRTRSFIDKKIEDIGFDGYICGCGTYIELDNQILYSKTIDKERYSDIITFTRENQIEAIFEGTKAIFMDFESQNENTQYRIKKFMDLGINIKPYDSEDLCFDKFFATLEDRNNLDYIRKYLESRESLICTEISQNNIEVVPQGHSKASGMEVLLNHYNIGKENSFAFGDSYNDLDMFKYCPNSILMANGNKELTNMVNFVTREVENDGIEYALKHFNIL